MHEPTTDLQCTMLYHGRLIAMLLLRFSVSIGCPWKFEIHSHSHVQNTFWYCDYKSAMKNQRTIRTVPLMPLDTVYLLQLVATFESKTHAKETSNLAHAQIDGAFEESLPTFE